MGVRWHDPLTRQRVQRLRQARRERGDREMNVWVSKLVGHAIDEAVASGRFPSRQVAIAHALEATFFERSKTR